MQSLGRGVLGEAVVLGENIAVRRADDAGDGRILREPPALHQQFERAVAAPPGRYLIAAGFLALGVQQRADAETLEQPPAGNIVGEGLDRPARSEEHTSELQSLMRN